MHRLDALCASEAAAFDKGHGMHELPIVEDIIRCMDRESGQRGFSRISEIKLSIGELSGMVGECVQMYFDILSEGHSCEGAKLVFEYSPVKFICSSCGREYERSPDFRCPACGGEGIRKRGSGSEFSIKSFEGEP
ncbi:MAG: hydrogenase maturation nickel metallochaperone HypA [Lachnospiraceae bacterium]|nr:hydrogenase maturation nickel metallochaperone HypA [Lachnospiraceae bacterium]